MGSGSIRVGESNSVPLSGGVWFVVVTMVNKKINHEFYHTTISGKHEFLDCLKHLKAPYKIYAIWHGAWSTDIFDMDKTILIKRLKQDAKQREDERKKRR
jgi:hypothetical protein